MTWALIAVGLAVGVDWRRLAVVSAAVLFPVPVGVLAVAHCWRSRSGASLGAALFCDAVSAELRAGSSVRLALESAAGSVEATEVATACREGAPLGEVARLVGATFPEIGVEIRALVAGGDGVGSRPAALFDELASIALAQAEVKREVAAASAPAKATAAVLIGVPALALVLASTRGELNLYLDQPLQRGAVLAGFLLTGIGLGISVLMMSRSR